MARERCCQNNASKKSSVCMETEFRRSIRVHPSDHTHTQAPARIVAVCHRLAR